MISTYEIVVILVNLKKTQLAPTKSVANIRHGSQQEGKQMGNNLLSKTDYKEFHYDLHIVLVQGHGMPLTITLSLWEVFTK